MDNPLTPDEWVARLATLPLIDQPGAGFHYGNSTDLLGILISRLDGEPLCEVLRRRVFAPARNARHRVQRPAREAITPCAALRFRR
jgi:CubicO group peptidase (beta-lactamase class C family)